MEAAGADLLHFDVMDGHFVDNITFGPDVVQAFRRLTKLPLDVHLMISEPARYIDRFIEAEPETITSRWVRAASLIAAEHSTRSSARQAMTVPVGDDHFVQYTRRLMG